jgi:putative transcriptional regulator
VNDVSFRGRLLVAAPPLVDPNFDRTVVLVLEHGREGALGIVLNRPGDTELHDAVPEWAPLASEPAVVFEGGPVATEAVIALACTETKPGADRRGGGVAESTIESDQSDERDGWVPIVAGVGTVDLARAPGEIGAELTALRVFVGYAGWAPGQLEGELEQGAWFVVDLEHDDVFGAGAADLWRTVLRRQRGGIAIFASCPADPSTN